MLMLTHQTGRRRSASVTAPTPLGPANGDVDFFAHGACAQPGVDAAIFTSEEDDHDAVSAARAVCSSCPVRLPCRRYAYAANPYGVYAGETQTERAANLTLGGLAAHEPRHHGEVVA
jgi:WhiB family transcriptional regulator, redox-sensing transcriptional regulator